MSRLLQCGWETGDTNQIGTDAIGTSTGSVSVVTGTPTPRSGSYCLKCLPGISTSSTSWTAFKGAKSFSHASKTELWYAFGMFAHQHTSGATTPNYVFAIFRDTSGNVNCFLALDGGTIRAYYVTSGGANPAANYTLIAAASASMSLDVWHLIEVRIVAATGSTGNFEVYLDGSSVISTSSQRTCQTNANFGSFELGWIDIGNTPGTTAVDYHAFDDLRVNDTTGPPNNGRPGDEKIVMLTPNAAGDSTQWSRGGADSGNNYGQVDDIPPNGTTDYVYDTTVGHLDLYNVTTQAVGAVSAVNVIAQAFNADGAGGSINLVTKTGAGQSDGSAQSLTGAAIYYNRLLETDPADSGTWTQAKIDALQIGPKLAS